MESTPKYTASQKRVYLTYFSVLFYPPRAGKFSFFLWTHQGQKYTKVHQVHPDQIETTHPEVHPRAIVATVAQI